MAHQKKDCYKRAVLFLAHRSTSFRRARLLRYVSFLGLLQTGSPFFGAPLHFVASSALASLCVYLWTATNGQSFFWRTASLRGVMRACFAMCLFLDCYKRAVLFFVFQNYFPENVQKHREYQKTSIKFADALLQI